MTHISIVTPTFYRHHEIDDYLNSIINQTLLPDEVIIVDGAPNSEVRTEEKLKSYNNLPFHLRYYRKTGGTAIQRNFGIAKSTGEIIVFVDDDVRLDPWFLQSLINYYESDNSKEIGGITGYRKNCYFNIEGTTRWKWYKRLNLLTIFDPGFYDKQTGIPINNNGQSPFSGIREVDFMTTACTSYRKEYLELERFDEFFVGYGILEDAQLALRIKYKLGKKLFQCGEATCIELSSPNGRTNRKVVGERTVINYFYTFESVFGPLTKKQKIRFIKFQLFELLRATTDLLRFKNKPSLDYFLGKVKGILLLILKMK